VKSSEIKKVFKSFGDYRILIIGDAMLDAYMWGKVDRISPEAPIPIIASTNLENRLGGAANVALNIKSMGANPYLCSVIGDDDKGEILLQRLEMRGIPSKGIIKNRERKTTVKTRIISNNQHLLRIDEEESSPVGEHLEKDLLQKITGILDGYSIQAVVFEDYDKGVITPFLIEEVTRRAKEKGIPVLADPKKRNFHHYRNVDLFKPNFRELKEGLNLTIDKTDTKGIVDAIKPLHTDWKNKLVFITLSELGVLISDGQKHYSLPAEVRDIADVSGAGDTLIGVSSLFLAAGFSPKDIAGIANLAGGLVCEKVGVVPVDKDDLLEELLIRNINGYLW